MDCSEVEKSEINITNTSQGTAFFLDLNEVIKVEVAREKQKIIEKQNRRKRSTSLFIPLFEKSVNNKSKVKSKLEINPDINKSKTLNNTFTKEDFEKFQKEVVSAYTNTEQDDCNKAGESMFRLDQSRKINAEIKPGLSPVTSARSKKNLANNDKFKSKEKAESQSNLVSSQNILDQFEKSHDELKRLINLNKKVELLNTEKNSLDSITKASLLPKLPKWAVDSTDQDIVIKPFVMRDEAKEAEQTEVKITEMFSATIYKTSKKINAAFPPIGFDSCKYRSNEFNKRSKVTPKIVSKLPKKNKGTQSQNEKPKSPSKKKSSQNGKKKCLKKKKKPVISDIKDVLHDKTNVVMKIEESHKNQTEHACEENENNNENSKIEDMSLEKDDNNISKYAEEVADFGKVQVPLIILNSEIDSTEKSLNSDSDDSVLGFYAKVLTDTTNTESKLCRKKLKSPRGDIQSNFFPLTESHLKAHNEYNSKVKPQFQKINKLCCDENSEDNCEHDNHFLRMHTQKYLSEISEEKSVKSMEKNNKFARLLDHSPLLKRNSLPSLSTNVLSKNSYSKLSKNTSFELTSIEASLDTTFKEMSQLAFQPGVVRERTTTFSSMFSENSEIATPRPYLRSVLGNASCYSGYSSCSSSTKSLDQEVIEWQKGKLIDRGAFGAVYQGLTNKAQIIAVKEVDIGIAKDARKMYKKLEEEVAILKGLRHRNVIKFIGTSLEEDCVCIFMEYIPGGSLAGLISNFGPLNEAVYQRYTKQILHAVHYIHGQGVIHRDIKGANILVTVKGIIKLIDFGCAKELSLSVGRSVFLKSVKGTPFWMAPEVIQTTGCNHKSDIWSLGCTMMEMAHGKPPWSEYEPFAAMFAIAENSTSLPQLEDRHSEHAKDFVRVCLTRDKSKRPSAEDLMAHPFIIM